MDKTIRVYNSLDEMKSDEYQYWQNRPGYERMDAVAEITLATYAMKGAALDVPRLQRTLVHLQRTQRQYLIVGGYAVSFHHVRGYIAPSVKGGDNRIMSHGHSTRRRPATPPPAFFPI